MGRRSKKKGEREENTQRERGAEREKRNDTRKINTENTDLFKRKLNTCSLFRIGSLWFFFIAGFCLCERCGWDGDRVLIVDVDVDSPGGEQ